MIDLLYPARPSEGGDSHEDLLGTPRECLNFYRAEGQGALGVLFQKVSAFLETQSCLTITYGLAMLNDNPRWGDIFTLVVPAALGVFAIVCCLHAWPSVKASCETVLHWQRKQLRMIGRLSASEKLAEGNPLLSRRQRRIEDQQRAILYAKLAPPACALFWILLCSATVAIQY